MKRLTDTRQDPTGEVFSTGQIKVGYGISWDCPAKN